MKTVLLDTNIIIHREASTIANQDIGTLYRWLDRAKYTKYVHSMTITEIEKHQNQQTVNTFRTKIDSYEKIEIASPLHVDVKAISDEIDTNQNDINDTMLINEVYVGRVDILISEDKKIHKKALLLKLENKIFTIDSFLETIYAENPDLVDYKVLNVQKLKFGQLDLTDAFFDNLRDDYGEFDKWFIKKYDENAYITINQNNGKLLSFLYLKIEGKDEIYRDINPIFIQKKRLKIGTFKVISNGFRLGERFMKIIFDNAIKNKVDEIYVTIFDKRDEQRRLINLLEIWGFVLWGKKNSELIYVRNFTKLFDIDNLARCYPYISCNRDCFIVPIYPDYHTELLPDSILNTESADDFVEDYPHRNSINKVYVSRALKPHPKKGDILVFYRTGGYYKSVISTIGIVQDIRYDFKNEDDFTSYCRKISVFPEEELHKMWIHKFDKPFVIKFLYTYSFPHRINMARLIELKIFKGVNDAPRGFYKITKEQFKTILKETKSDDSFTVD